DLVAAEIVHDDAVARSQLWGEHLLDIGPKDAAIHGAADHERRDEAVDAQPGEERRRVPVAVRHDAFGPLATRRAGAQAGHVRRGPGLVDEDEALRAQFSLALAPDRAYRGDVGPRLL